MSKEEADKKRIFKQIFKDGWEEFKKRHPRYAGVDEVVQKMLGCGEFQLQEFVLLVMCQDVYRQLGGDDQRHVARGSPIPASGVDGAGSIAGLVLPVPGRIV